MVETPLSVPRSSFTPREVCRAGDVWRAFQDLAVEGSRVCGWPPERYRETQVFFIVRSMTAVHEREIGFGEPLLGTTWPSRFRRGMFFRRECRIHSCGNLLSAATQEWVHVDANLRPARASSALAEAFAVEDGRDASIVFPAFERCTSSRAHEFDVVCWQTWVDPVGHVNHPAYVDFCDEGISRVMQSRALDPIRLLPVAEEVQFRSAIQAGERVSVRTRLVGVCPDRDAAVFQHEILAGDLSAGQEGRLCAKATLLRSYTGDEGGAALVRIFRDV